MAKSNEQQLDEAVVAVVRAAQACADGKMQQLHISYQASGEYPYRIEVPDETLPLVGVGRDAG